MTRIGVYEAKTRFSELVARAEKGEEFEITKNDRPVARLTTLGASQRPNRAEAGARALAQLRRLPGRDEAAEVDWETLKRWSNEGRPGCD